MTQRGHTKEFRVNAVKLAKEVGAGGRCHDNQSAKVSGRVEKKKNLECYEIKKISSARIKDIVPSYYL